MSTEVFLIPTSVLSTRSSALSSDDPVRSYQHVRRNREADLLRGFQVDDQLELHRLLDRKVARLCAFQNFIISLTNVHRPSAWRSFRSMASISGFVMAPSLRPTIVRLMVRKIPVTKEGKSNPAPFQSANR